jgi:hypothetical protein
MQRGSAYPDAQPSDVLEKEFFAKYAASNGMEFAARARIYEE